MDASIGPRGALAALALAAAASGPAAARVAAPNVALAPPAVAETAGASGADAAAESTPRQIGFPRTVGELQTAAGLKRQLQWTRVPEGGAVAAVSVTSPGAIAVRAALRVGDLPSSAILRFYAPGDATPREVSAEQVFAVLARNREAGESGAQARTYWSPVVGGDTIVIEVELPPGADPAQVALTTPLVSHFTSAPGEPGADEGRASAVYTTDGSSYACPGTLVAGAPGGARYLLTRERCVATQAAASTLQVFWPAARDAAASGVGATLLYASPATDTAFLLLDAPPAAAARLARAAPEGVDPGLEQWIGNGASSGAVIPAASFSLP